MKFLQKINPDTWMTVQGSIALVWGIWYANPVVRNILDGSASYFEPPLIVGVFAAVLGILSVTPIRKTFKRALGIAHILFWTYLTIFLALTNIASSIFPVGVVLVIVSVLVYVLQESYVR
jgi:hypothetical protein